MPLTLPKLPGKFFNDGMLLPLIFTHYRYLRLVDLEERIRLGATRSRFTSLRPGLNYKFC
jgi:hypothetical protein